MFALAAKVETSSACPILGMATVRATEALWPTKLKKVIKAGFLRVKPAIKLNFVNRKIFYHSDLLVGDEVRLNPLCDI